MRGWEVAVQQPYAISLRLTSLLSLQQTNKDKFITITSLAFVVSSQLAQLSFSKIHLTLANKINLFLCTKSSSKT